MVSGQGGGNKQNQTVDLTNAIGWRVNIKEYLCIIWSK